MEQSLRTELFLPVLSAKTNEQQPRVSQRRLKVWSTKSSPSCKPRRTLTYADEYGEYDGRWTRDAGLGLGSDLENNAAVVGFVSTFSDTMRTLTSDVLTPAQDAKLVIENGKVKNFKPAKPAPGEHG